MEKIVKKSYPVTGMSCASCALNAENALSGKKGVRQVSVNIANAMAQVEFSTEEVSEQELRKAVQSVGFDLLVDEAELDPEYIQQIQRRHYKKLVHDTTWAIVFSVPLVGISMFGMNIPDVNQIMLLLATPVLVFFGRRFFVNAFKLALKRNSNMDTLVALSTGIAFLFSVFNTFYAEFWLSRGLHPHVYFEASAVVISFILLGKLLEERAKSNTSSAIRKLMGLQPKNVTRIDSQGKEQIIPASQVQRGDKILIKPGDKIPVDGEVLSGSSFVDESTITGEPIPVEKTTGNSLFTGTLNQKGSFVMIARKVGSETVLAQIIKMVQQAQSSKAPVQKLVDKVAGIFVPVIISIAVLTFALWLIFGGQNAVIQALMAMVTVLVIACPCALGLATPTAIMVGMGKGAENGILIKDAESLELAHKVNTIILDKTGTVTEGKPEVTDLIWNINDNNKTHYTNILRTIESKSEHPLAEAVTQYLLNENNYHQIELSDFKSLTGKGVQAQFMSQKYWVGNERLAKDENLVFSENNRNIIRQLENESKTVVLFAHDTELLAIIAIADNVKQTSAKAIEQLKKQGIAVYMLTGDNASTANAVARKVGIDHVQSEMLPTDKALFISNLQQQGKIVAMVGDGINDSHALAQADVSIAMGKGSDIAMDVAKMTIISSDLLLIPRALQLSRQTVKTIRQNLFWAFIYNLIGIPIAAGILYPLWGFMLNPMIAGAAMAFSSVSVVSNSLRLKFKKLRH
jgi:P-type Cu2+ transporter